MSATKVGAAADRIFKGYFRAFRGLLGVVALLGAAVAASAAIVFPLWLLSTQHRRLYSFIVLALCAFGILFASVRKMIELARRPGLSLAKGARKVIVRTALTIVALALLYLLLGLFFARLFYVAVPLAAGYVVALGYLLYVRKPTRNNRS